MKQLLLHPAAVCLSFLIFNFSFLTGFAQEAHPVSGEPLKYCGSTEATQDLYRKYPHLKDVAEIIEQQQMEQKTNPEPLTTHPPVYTIPVVVHILHNYGPENFPDANVYDAIRILNLDFRKRNADTTQIAPAFKARAADAEIEFKLAQLDPTGKCTNGIDRIATSKTYNANDASKLNIWPRNKYLNIWTVHDIASGAAGYTYVPATVAGSPGVDGIIILYNYFSSLAPSFPGTSRALTHEIGHWFNLQHCWGPTNQPGVSCGNDGVTDTPVTKGWTSCNLTNNAVCVNGVQENVQNYMEYAYCDRMFTKGQVTRMRSALISSTAQRNNLWTSANLAATGVNASAQLCTANFSANKTVVCAGASVSFTDVSWNKPPTSWQWDFDNDGTTDATTQNPAYTYSAPGVYSVKLTVGDGTTTKTVTKTSLIVVLANTASTQPPFSASFENTGYPYSDWYNSSVSSNVTVWNRVTTAAYTGSASLKLDNYSATFGDMDLFITPSIDMSTVTSPVMTFRLAYQRKSTSDTLHGLKVFTSVNCGNSWVLRYTKNYPALATVTNVSASAFTPTTASQWRQDNVPISNVNGQSNVRFKFEFTGYGINNNIYIDDINITGNVSVTEEWANGFGLNIFPNPFNAHTTVSFTLHDKYPVAIGVYDILGKAIISLSNPTELSAGSYSFPLNKAALKQGIYLVKLDVNGHSVMRKMIVQ